MPDQAAPKALQRVTELRVSGHLMTLETGLFCIVNQASPHPGADGLPGVRLSLPPGVDPRHAPLAISGFREDGWLSSAGDAALVRVSEGPVKLLVTIYQGDDPAVPAPNLQVMRLTEAAAEPPLRRPEPALPAPSAVLAPPRPLVTPPPASAPAGPREVSAHVQRRGDLTVALGDWIGDPRSQRWIEGFAIAPQNGMALEDLEYQAVLGRGWLSPWVEGGQFCGSRGMALPILGLRIRLRGAAEAAFELSLTATFVDGSEVGPVGNGEACEADTLAPLEAFLLALRPRRRAARPAAAAAPTPTRKPAPAPASARKAVAKPPAKAVPKPKPAQKPAPRRR